jgi:hypothetical protein
VKRIAKWDGSTWSPLGTGLASGSAWVLHTHDDGSGPALFAGGDFLHAGGVFTLGLARWNGTLWSSVGSPTLAAVRALESFDDGSGPALFAGGLFTKNSPSGPMNYVAKWNGTEYSPLGVGTSYWVHALEASVLNGESSLYVGGQFAAVPDSGDSFIARWGGCPTYESFCTAGTSASGCLATVSAVGTSSASAPSGFTIQASTVEGSKDGLFYFATNGRQASAWGNGTSLQCVLPPVQRASLLSGSGTPGACDGLMLQDLNAFWTAQPNKNPGAGAVVQAQLWYRDPQNTSNQTTGLSNALEFTVGL